MSDQHSSDKVLHQDEQEAVIDERLEDSSAQGVIADLAAPSAGYVEAEALAARNKINLILGVLRDSGLIPTA